MFWQISRAALARVVVEAFWLRKTAEETLPGSLGTKLTDCRKLQINLFCQYRSRLVCLRKLQERTARHRIRTTSSQLTVTAYHMLSEIHRCELVTFTASLILPLQPLLKMSHFPSYAMTAP